jgi:hypothetical protein
VAFHYKPRDTGRYWLAITWDNQSPGGAFVNTVRCRVVSSAPFSASDTTPFAGYVLVPSSDYLVANMDGALGVGTSAPTERVDVNGNVRANGFCIGADCRAAWPTTGVGGTGADRYLARWSGATALASASLYEAASGFVGLGTTAPAEKLHVAAGNVDLDAGYELRWRDRDDQHLREDNYSLVASAAEGVRINLDSNANGTTDTTKGFEIARDTATRDGGTVLFSVSEADGHAFAESIWTRPFAQTFTVGGDFSTYYPIIFEDSAWGEGPFELELTRSNTHTDSSWRGSLESRFTCHSTNWGHGADFCRAEIYSSAAFVAGYQSHPTSMHFIVWLRGGGTTYTYRSNQRVTVYDATAAAKTLSAGVPVAYGTKATVDSYVMTNGPTFDKDLKVRGTVSADTRLLTAKLGSNTCAWTAWTNCDGDTGDLGEGWYVRGVGVQAYLDINFWQMRFDLCARTKAYKCTTN